MVNLKKWIFALLSIVLNFAIVFIVASNMFFTPCLSYYDKDDNFLNNYFSVITKEPVLTKATTKTHDYSYYADLNFSFGDFVSELSEYNYTLVDQEKALEILQDKSLDEKAYQVTLVIYSSVAQQNNISDGEHFVNLSNLVYFPYDGSIYTLAFFYDDNAYVGEYRALLKTDMKQFPDEFSDKVFENHGLIEDYLSRVNYAVTIRSLKTATLVTILECIVIFIIIMVKKKICSGKTVTRTSSSNL